MHFISDLSSTVAQSIFLWNATITNNHGIWFWWSVEMYFKVRAKMVGVIVPVMTINIAFNPKPHRNSIQ